MYELKGLNTNALLVIIEAYSSDYGRTLTADETLDRLITIAELQEEIASRDIAPGLRSLLKKASLPYCL